MNDAINHYVFRSKKYIDKGRYAFLPEELSILINDGPNIHTTCPTIGQEFNSYVRVGIAVDSKNAFLNAIAHSIGKTGAELKEQLIKLDPELLSNECIDEDLLCDFITKPDVILPSGMNLIIFEKIEIGTRFKCPAYSNERCSIILYKYDGHYEPIYRLFLSKGERIVLEERFVHADNPIIQNVILDGQIRGFVF